MGEKQNDSTVKDSDIGVDQRLIEEGTFQLTNEIRVLESWLEELKASDQEDSESVATRKSYSDMLRSRREMLNTLTKQSKISSVAVD
ncbi:MAG: hypothetical protein P8K27_08770 [Gammaproteobacteria bacterium]|nr:hypothetical protein [Gammaproteobacteria bacterium]